MTTKLIIPPEIRASKLESQPMVSNYVLHGIKVVFIDWTARECLQRLLLASSTVTAFLGRTKLIGALVQRVVNPKLLTTVNNLRPPYLVRLKAFHVRGARREQLGVLYVNTCYSRSPNNSYCYSYSEKLSVRDQGHKLQVELPIKFKPCAD